MNKTANILLYLSLFFLLSNNSLLPQELSNIGLSTSRGLLLQRLISDDSTVIDLEDPRALFSFRLNGYYRQADNVNAALIGTRFILSYEESLRVSFTSFGGGHPGWRGEITFENEGFDTLVISNVLPLGEDRGNTFITAKGSEKLARSRLYIPDSQPLRVVLPDNAWESGYSSFRINDSLSVCFITRSGKKNGTVNSRYNTILPPNAVATFDFYGELYKGPWQEGLRKVFYDRYFYDVYEFDDALYQRKDLDWIQDSYLVALHFAWDRDFYDRFEGKYTYGRYLSEANSIFGHLDAFGLWPGWPRLGLDERSQWDMYRNLPGGIEQLRNFARLSRQYGTRFFIAYNPWDNINNLSEGLDAMSDVIKKIEADGVVLDTRSASSSVLREAADKAREGVVMYSEGMALVSEMQGIRAGRLHNAIFMSPVLNLNRLARPEFSVFRVCEVGEEPVNREIAVSFFNACGTELNMFRPGRNDQLQNDEFAFLARTTMILRENSSLFHENGWLPLVYTGKDKLFVNRWGTGDNIIYTVLSLRPGGVNEALIKVKPDPVYHYVSLWNAKELKPVVKNGSSYIEVSADPYPAEYADTRKEGAVDCIARYRKLLRTEIRNDSLLISKPEDYSKIIIYKGLPSYITSRVELKVKTDTALYLHDLVGAYQGKLVVELFGEKELQDVNILTRTGLRPWLVSTRSRTKTEDRIPRDMVMVPGVKYSYTLGTHDNFIAYPALERKDLSVDTFLIDKYPVTNEQYYRFIVSTGYYPTDTLNYLRHWEEGIYKPGQENYPVVNVSYEDARAYAEWAGKRLPTENEWQLAAQGTDGRLWPWGNEFHGTRCNNSFGRATPVDAFQKGESQAGVFDLVGNIWQMTGDIYSNGSNYFMIIRGGSYYEAKGSNWYLKGGPQPLNMTQMLLMVSPGFDRSPALGFRCVRDY